MFVKNDIILLVRNRYVFPEETNYGPFANEYLHIRFTLLSSHKAIGISANIKTVIIPLFKSRIKIIVHTTSESKYLDKNERVTENVLFLRGFILLPRIFH